MILTGEINLKTMTDPTVPFGRVTTELSEADLVFVNLECLLADPPAESATDGRDEMDKLIAASQRLGASLTIRSDELVVIEKQGVLA
jgi:hypothetical protein